MKVSHFFRRLGVSEHEATRLKISWGLRFLYQIGFVIAWTIITALFVEQFGIHNLLWLFAFEGFLFLLGSVGASFLLRKINFQRYALGAVMLTLLSLGAALCFHPNSIYFFGFLLMAKDLFFYQISIALYRKNEAFFSPKEAQKMMPFVESAITIGSVVGALLTVEFLQIVPTQYVLGLWGLCLFLMAVLVFVTPKLLHVIPEFLKKWESHKAEPNPLREGLKSAFRIPFLSFLTLIILLQTAVFTVIEYEFTKDVQSHISHKVTEHHSDEKLPLHASLLSEMKETVHEVGAKTKHAVQQISTKYIVHETLAHDLGMFHLFFSLLALTVQLLLTPKLLEKTGVVGSIMSFFSILIASAGGLLFGYGNINTLRATQHGFHSFGESAYHVGFYSFFSHKRESIRLFLEGVIKPMGIFLGVGATLLVPEAYIFHVITGTTAALILLSLPMKKRFTKLSEKNIEQSDQLIAEKLEAIEVLEQKGHLGATQILAAELSDKTNHPIVRQKVIDALTHINDPETVHAYIIILRDNTEDQEMKVKVLKSLLQLTSLRDYWKNHAFGQYHLMHTLQELFKNAKHPFFRNLVVMNIFTHIAQHEVVPFFLKTMKKADEHLKAICLRSCTVFNDPEIVHYVCPYLEHKNPKVRGHAIIAMWKFGHKDTLRNIIQDLIYKNDEGSQIAAIYGVGEIKDKESESMLEPFLASPNPNIRLHAIIALAKLGDRSAIEPLLEILFGDDVELAQTAYRMLDRIPANMKDHIKEIIHAEVSREVTEIIKPQNIKGVEDFRQLPKKLLQKLEQLYRLGEKYDCLLALEQQREGLRA